MRPPLRKTDTKQINTWNSNSIKSHKETQGLLRAQVGREVGQGKCPKKVSLELRATGRLVMEGHGGQEKAFWAEGAAWVKLGVGRQPALEGPEESLGDSCVCSAEGPPGV